MITIVDYGVGNLGSIQNMLRYLGYESQISDSKAQIEEAEKLILPGIGSFDFGMSQLAKRDMIDVLNYKILDQKKPVLGICLGVQLMTRGSEEGELDGLGWFQADTVRFEFSDLGEDFSIPHMGWNFINTHKDSALNEKMHDNSKFYFVHSYHLKADDPTDVLYVTRHGYDFAAALEKDNMVGCQFHPEKSHKYGMRLLDNFVKNY
uniref:imidazole glycerol phosphate synthase subunit HisH n=2 Tax=Roseivirga sp. TaxID=1964215 RepID=UPI004047FF1E